MPLPKSSADFALPAQQAGSRLSRRSVMALGALGTVAGLAGYAFGVEPRWVSVEHHEMAIPNLPKHLVGKTLVQLSDTHIGSRVDPEYLLRQFDYVSSLQPDFVCFTGDFIDQVDSWHVQEGIRLMERFPRGHSGTVCVLGNHDYVSPSHGRDDSGETNRLIDAFADADGLELLINDSVEMNGLHFAGLPDLWYGGLRRSLSKRVIQKLEGKPSVVLSHNPDTADLPIWGDFDSWVLCGHTHGGQCTFPIIGAPLLPVANREYVSGAFDIDNQFKMFINRGIGHSTRVRFMARPEITVFTLADSQQSAATVEAAKNKISNV